MRKEFYIGTQEDMTDYIERAAAYLRSIKKGTLIDGGINLSEALPVEEQKELMQYIYDMVIELMMKTSGRYVLNRIDFGSYRDDFIGNYAEVILKRLDLFRDPERLTSKSKVKYLGYTFYRYKGKCRFRVHPKSATKMKNKIREVVECESKRLTLSKSIQEILLSRVCELMVKDFGKFNSKYEETGEMYSFECFIKNRIKGCIRDSIAEEQGLTVNRSRQLYTITKIRSAIVFDNQMEEENVSVELIYQRLEQEAEDQKKRPISKKLLIELLDHLNGVEYISELEEQGIQIASKEEKHPFELEKETIQILDGIFSNMTSLDYYILLKEYGLLGEEIRKQEMDQFVKTETFLRLMDEDNSIKSEQNLVKMAYNKKSKIKKILKSINGKVDMTDLEGGLEDYLYMKKQEYRIP